mmetsp:Transcript_54521/g.100890  ORF Transcript_54521/g.100890 Transcript_54521/m.100890 type:complete len:323 (-) Transcript_54521:128-1096(-)
MEDGGADDALMCDSVLGGGGQALLLECTLDFLSATDVVTAIHVCSFWQSVARSDAVWSRQCDRLWSDKVFVPESLRSMSSCSRIKAYWESVADSTREHLTEEELCSLTWYCRMKGWAGEDWTNNDPWWQGKSASQREFRRDGTTFSTDRGVGAWRFVKDSSGCSGPWGSFVRMSRQGRDFPTHFVSRHAKNWGWILQNCWGFSASFPLPLHGEDAELEDDGPCCQKVTVDKCIEEASLFNMGRPLPYEGRADNNDDSDLDGHGIRIVVPPGVDEEAFLALLRNIGIVHRLDRQSQEDEESGEDEEGASVPCQATGSPHSDED